MWHESSLQFGLKNPSGRPEQRALKVHLPLLQKESTLQPCSTNSYEQPIQHQHASSKVIARRGARALALHGPCMCKKHRHCNFCLSFQLFCPSSTAHKALRWASCSVNGNIQCHDDNNIQCHDGHHVVSTMTYSATMGNMQCHDGHHVLNAPHASPCKQGSSIPAAGNQGSRSPPVGQQYACGIYYVLCLLLDAMQPHTMIVTL